MESSPPIPAPRRERVRQLADQGLTPRQIADVLHISTQGVYKHQKRLRAEGWIPKHEQDGAA